MNRIDSVFANLRVAGRKAFVAYLGAGDPDLAATPELVLALERAGADVVELGLPFSDPLADGLVNQLSAQRALEAGATFPKVLEMIRALRRRSQIPVVLYAYVNPLLRGEGGAAASLRAGLEELAEAGVDGALVLDLPPEESLGAPPEELFPEALRRITLISPTTPPERLAALSRAAGGFVYYVSREGVTGARSDVAAGIPERVAAVRAATETPVCVGFGISTPEQARAVAAQADGAVVGSVLVSQVAQHGKAADLPARLEAFARPFAEAIHGA